MIKKYLRIYLNKSLVLPNLDPSLICRNKFLYNDESPEE